jgi:hypothetical protein
VLYDNILVHDNRVHPYGFWLEPYHIDVGMYGLQVANVRLHQDGKTESLGDTRGDERTLRPTRRANVSAVAVLYDHASDYGLFLIVYHNYYARIPLPQSVFANAKDRQLEKADPQASPGPWLKVQN